MHRDFQFSHELVGSDKVDRDSISGKTALARHYFGFGSQILAFNYYADLFVSGNLTDTDLSDALDCGEKLGVFNFCEKVIIRALEIFPDNLGWKCRGLMHQAKICHQNPEQAQHISNNLSYLLKRVATSTQFQSLSFAYFSIGRHEESQVVMNKALQLAVVGEGEEPHQSPFNQNETLSFCQRIISALRAEFNIQGFPVFGTLLGLYRDGELMKYDKDSDLGVIYDERYNIGTMIEVLNQKYGVLCADKVFLEEQHLRYCVGVYDKDSGAACDIFFYHRNDSKYETGISRTGSKLLWEHDLFDLEERVFSGYTYLCPTNIEHYLEETYGADWREPISMWDSLVSCPNLKKESQILVANFACQRLYVSLIYGDIAKATYYVEKLISRWPGILDAQTMDNLKKKITKYEE